jgi:polyhydroxyalkanoate synthesis regulator phasin
LLALLSIAVVGGILLGADQVSAAPHRGRAQHRSACFSAIKGGIRLTSTLDQLVANGTITAEQESAIINQLIIDRAGGPRSCDGIGLARDGQVGQAIANLLGTDRREIRQAWRDGQSLSEMAAAKGIDRQTLVDAIVTAIGDRIDQAVEKGRITADQKSEIVSNITPSIERAIDLHRGELRQKSGTGGTPSATPSPVSASSERLIA